MRRFVSILLFVAFGLCAYAQKPSGLSGGRQSGFELSLAAPDSISIATGDLSSLALWQLKTLAARDSVFVVGRRLQKQWAAPLLKLKSQRPDVKIYVLLDGEATEAAPAEDVRVLDALEKAGVLLRMRPPKLVRDVEFPSPAGLLMIRDDQTHLNGVAVIVSGDLAETGEGALVQAWALDSTPAVRNYGELWRQFWDVARPRSELATLKPGVR